MLQRHLNIIVPTLDEAAHIRNCLVSLQDARAAGHRVWVVDGGSSDNTIEMASTLADHVLRSRPGRATQLELGARAADSGDFWFLHADCVVPKDGWKHVQNALEEGAAWGRFSVSLSGSARSFRVIEYMINLRARASGIVTGDQGLFVERTTFEKVGGIPQLPLMEDIALTRKLRAQAWPKTLDATIQTSSRRWEDRGIVRTVVLMWWLRLAYYFGVAPERLARWYR